MCVAALPRRVSSARYLPEAAPPQDREHGLPKRRDGIPGEIVASPGDEAVWPHEQAALVGHIADLGPLAVQIIEVLAQTDAGGLYGHAEFG